MYTHYLTLLTVTQNLTVFVTICVWEHITRLNCIAEHSSLRPHAKFDVILLAIFKNIVKSEWPIFYWTTLYVYFISFCCWSYAQRLTLWAAILWVARRFVALQVPVVDSWASRTWPSRAHVTMWQSPVCGRNLAWNVNIHPTSPIMPLH